MSEANTRTEYQLRQDFATFQLMFSVQKFIVDKILSEANDSDFKLLGEKREIVVPINDEEVVMHLRIIEDTLGDLISLTSSLNQLGEDLNISFDIVNSESNIYPEVNPFEHPFVLSISAFPEEHYNEEARDFAEEIQFEENDYVDKEKIIDESQWQKNFSGMN